MTWPIALLLALTTATMGGQALARSSDRNQPVDINADDQDCDVNENGQCTFVGNVTMTQGTLELRSAKATLHRSNGEISRIVLTGSPATMKQEMDDGTPMDARAQTIDYDVPAEVITMTGAVRVVQPRGTMTGARLVYDTKSGRVNSGNVNGTERVRMVIQPKTAQPAAAGKQPAPTPRPATPPAGTGNN